MQIKKIIAVSATAVLMSGAAMAQQTTDPVVDGIVQELAAEGYSKIKIRRTFTGRFRVEAQNQNQNRETERVYDAAGNLVREDGETNRERTRTRTEAQVGMASTDIDSTDDDVSDDDSSDDDGDDGDDGDDNDD